jgi:hypothetical protein
MPQTLADQFASIPMSPNLDRSLARAQEFAREQSHRALLLEHLLLALTEDPEATAVLRACNVDLVRLGADVSNYLGRLPEDMRAQPGAEPEPDPELLRVLEAARQAGAQSRRKHIDGSIVLAAVVGDGKSPAAGLLETHGMTFEEAIRALQKASAQARTKQYSAAGGPGAPERTAPAETDKAAPAPPVAPPAELAGGVADTPVLGQSVDEILAAARTRIQQRNATAAGKAEPKPPAAPGQQNAPDELPLMSLSTFQAAPAPPPPDLPPPLEGRPDALSDGFGPAAAPGSPPPQGRYAQPPPPEHPPPPRPMGQPAAGLPPPPPPRAGADAAAALRLPGWTARAQRPEPDALPPPPRSMPADGRMPAQRRSPPRGSGGPLVETIPRQMRVGAPAPAQVRIGRDKVDGLVQLLLAGRAQHRPVAVAAHALTVRLTAPDGGFWIEPATPETQWADTAPTDHAGTDDPIGWRWTVTPQRGGRRRLQLHVAARTIGRDGIAVEAAPPDRTIEVAVRGHPLRRIARWIALLALLGVAAALGRFGQELWEVGPTTLWARLVGGIQGLLASSGFLGG